MNVVLNTILIAVGYWGRDVTKFILSKINASYFHFFILNICPALGFGNAKNFIKSSFAFKNPVVVEFTGIIINS